MRYAHEDQNGAWEPEHIFCVDHCYYGTHTEDLSEVEYDKCTISTCKEEGCGE
jgi:hypothetical protein